jgi:hypothetical protein
MPTNEGKEDGAAYQKRIAQALKASGYSLKGCQLVLTDFQILENVMGEGMGDLTNERVKLYLQLCRRSRIENRGKTKGECRYALVIDGRTTIAMAHGLEPVQKSRERWRMYGGSLAPQCRRVHLFCGC